MIITETKIFEREVANLKDREEARTLLAKDVSHYISFFKDEVVDYQVSYTCCSVGEGKCLSAMVILRHKKAEEKKAWRT